MSKPDFDTEIAEQRAKDLNRLMQEQEIPDDWNTAVALFITGWCPAMARPCSARSPYTSHSAA